MKDKLRQKDNFIDKRFFANVFFLLAAFTLQPFSALADDEPQEIISYNGQTNEKANILYPETMEEYALLVTESYRKGNPVKVLGNTHSTSSIILSPGATYLSTKKLNKIHGTFSKDGKTYVKIQPGVKLGDLSDYLAEKNLSLGFAFPMFRDLTAAGVVSTGSHGSSRLHTSVSAQTVDSLKVLNPNTGHWIQLKKNVSVDVTAEMKEIISSLTPTEVKIILNQLSDRPEYRKLSPRMKLAKDALTTALFKTSTVDLGAAFPKGELVLEVVPQFNIKLTTQAVSIDDMLTKDRKMNWNPTMTPAQTEDSLVVKIYFHAGKAIIETGEITQEPAMKGAENVNFGTGFDTVEQKIATRNFMESTHMDMALGAKMEEARVAGTLKNPLFVVQDEIGNEVRKQQVIGPSNKMTQARGKELSWLFRPSDFSFSFPESSSYEIIKAIQEFSLRTGYSFPFTGLSCRFVGSDPNSSFMSHVEQPNQPKGTRYVVAEILEYRPLEWKGPAPLTPRTVLIEELIQILKKYDVKFHWGKNTDEIFEHEHIKKTNGKNFELFKTVLAKLDPRGIFRNDFVSRILGLPKYNRNAQTSCQRYYL